MGSSRISTGGLVDERAGEPDALPVALGERSDDLAADVADHGALARPRRPGRDRAAWHALHRGAEAQVLLDPHLRVERDVLRQVADPARTPSGSRARSMPATRTLPAVAERNPVIIRIVVVLPAPLGPRKPSTSPSGTKNETS